MSTRAARLLKTTPVRIVDRIEPSLPFWCGALGYEKRAEVPHGDGLGFVLLEHPSAGTLMLQTRASLQDDIPEVAKLAPHTVLFCEVPSLEEAIRATEDARVLVSERTTFYGMRERVVLDPGGTVVILAEKTARAS